MKAAVENVNTTPENILSNPYSSILFLFDKRRRNLEKRKMRLLHYDEDMNSGKQLSEPQVVARHCIGEVEKQLEFFKDLGKTLSTLQKQFSRSMKLREEKIRKEYEEKTRKLLAELIGCRDIVEQFQKEEVKKAFTNGTDNAVVLNDTEWEIMNELSNVMVGSKFMASESFSDYMRRSEQCANSMFSILIGGKQRSSNYSSAQVQKILEKISSCDYLFNKKKGHEALSESEKEEVEEIYDQKKVAKVVFVHGANDSFDGSVDSESNDAGETEFGFDSSTETTDPIVRDPPSPIPLPNKSVVESSSSPVPSLNGDAKVENDLWELDQTPETATKKISENAKIGTNVIHENGYVPKGPWRGTSFANRVPFNPRVNEDGKVFEERSVSGQRLTRNGRENNTNRFTARAIRGGSKTLKGTTGVGSNGGFRGVNTNYNSVNGRKGLGKRNGAEGNGYNSGYIYDEPPQRHLGFNFASDSNF